MAGLNFCVCMCTDRWMRKTVKGEMTQQRDIDGMNSSFFSPAAFAIRIVIFHMHLKITPLVHAVFPQTAR